MFSAAAICSILWRCLAKASASATISGTGRSGEKKMPRKISRRWFSWPNILLLLPVPIATALVAFGTWRALSGTSQSGAFIGAIGLFALSYAGIAISLWPMIVPHHYTLWQAASSPSTQAFLMVGTLFLLPVILVYTGWSYWVFRGKVRADVGYH